MGIGPIELIIISAICCIPVALAAVVGIVLAIVKFANKDNSVAS